jgi:hypothetical protein
VADFTWSVDEEYPEWIYLDLVTIDPDERASGLGLTVIREWERRLGEIGFESMELSAEAMGKYFWAQYGYTWALGQAPDNVLDHARKVLDNPVYLAGMARSMGGNTDNWPDTWPDEDIEELRLRVEEASQGQPVEPIDFASIGAYGDHQGVHLGKAFMLTGPMWDGVKDIKQ